MKLSAHVRRTGATFLLAALIVVGLGACDGGGGDGSSLPSDRPSADRSVTRPTADVTQTPRETADSTGRPSRTDEAAPTQRPTGGATPTQAPPPTTVQAQPEPTRAPEPPGAQPAPPATNQAEPPPVQQTPPPASDVAAEASTGAGDVWCLLLIVLVGLLVGGLVVWRTQHRSDWDVDATTLIGATTAVVNRLPSVLVTTTTGERVLIWPPLRDDLGRLIGSWDVLASRTADEARRGWAIGVRMLLQDLVASVDQENEALAADREWRLLRPRVAAAEQALSAALAAQPMAGVPVASQPGYRTVPADPTAGYSSPTGYPPGSAAYGSAPAEYASEPPGYPLGPPEPTWYQDEPPRDPDQPA
jgi:hypothetical protein